MNIKSLKKKYKELREFIGIIKIWLDLVTSLGPWCSDYTAAVAQRCL